MKKSAIRGSIKGLGDYRPISITFVDEENGTSEEVKGMARPVALSIAVAELGQKYENFVAGAGEPLTEAEGLAAANGIAVGLATSILDIDLQDENGKTIKPTIAEFKTWPLDELMNFWALTQVALSEAPKGNSKS